MRQQKFCIVAEKKQSREEGAVEKKIPVRKKRETADT